MGLDELMTVHDVAAALQDIPGLREMCRSIAMAEAVLNPCDYKYYSFDVRWSETEEAFLDAERQRGRVRCRLFPCRRVHTRLRPRVADESER
ncbi:MULTISPECIES: hypothetical protein [unclassified Streptomyces]|uniref:hypothetical protein n=1 Tax=unclassified Streptomyces TaxID=2593676 RepID=UPI002035AF2A|nr:MULTISPECIES: hypothetical protein [unclassified Streptomyces]